MKEGILYSICWEDYEGLTETIRPNDHVLMIGSAGCLALSALTSQPTKITVVDTNQDQLSLLMYKMAAMKKFGHDDAMKLFGFFERPCLDQTRVDLFEDLAHDVDAALGKWMNEHKKVLSKGLFLAGRFERYLVSFVKNLLPFVVQRKTIEAFLKSDSLEEQKQIYRDEVDGWLYRGLFKVFFGKFLMRKRGRHPDLMRHIQDDPGSLYYDRIARSWTGVPIAENYFFRFILSDHIDPTLAMPIWMECEAGKVIRQEMHRIEMHHSTILAKLQEQSDEQFDLIYLSDITETMTSSEAQHLFSSCWRRLPFNGRLVLWNNMLDRKPGHGWQKNEVLSERIWKLQRSSLYGDFGVYEKKAETA